MKNKTKTYEKITMTNAETIAAFNEWTAWIKRGREETRRTIKEDK